MSKPNKAGAGPQKAGSRANRESSKITTWLLEMLAVAIISIGGYRFLVAESEAAPRTREPIRAIVVVDTQRLMEARIDMTTEQIAQGGDYTQKDLEMQGQVFGTTLLKNLKRYRDDGVLVLDRRHALAIPPGSDITEQVASDLGLSLRPFSDPFMAPALSD